MVVTYVGAKSGRTYAIPVGYYRWEVDEVWAFSARTGWMTNLRDGRRTARLLIRRREYDATATIVEDRETVAELLTEFARRNGPKSARDPILGLPRDHLPSHDEALAAANRARIARFQLADAPSSRN